MGLLKKTLVYSTLLLGACAAPEKNQTLPITLQRYDINRDGRLDQKELDTLSYFQGFLESRDAITADVDRITDLKKLRTLLKKIEAEEQNDWPEFKSYYVGPYSTLDQYKKAIIDMTDEERANIASRTTVPVERLFESDQEVNRMLLLIKARPRIEARIKALENPRN